jgi:hypothetical protein
LLTGTGTITNNLCLGNDPGPGGLGGGTGGASITPGSLTTPGNITVGGNFQIFSGTLTIPVQSSTNYSSLVVKGYAALAGTASGAFTPATGVFNNGDKLTFLTAGAIQGAFASVTPPDPNWTWGKNPTSYWFEVVAAKVMGRVQENLNAAGITPSSPGVAATVTLAGPDGFKAITNTDSNGNYSFSGLDPGTYTLTFFTASYYGPIAPETFVRTLVLTAGEQDEQDLGVNLTAQPDSASTPYNTPVSIDVLANDETASDPPLSLSLSGSSPPQNGSAAVSGNQILYTPNVGFTGVDTFNYVVTDINGGTATALVTVSVGLGWSKLAFAWIYC